MYSQLENRELEGGYVRLHIKDLTQLRSRPSFENEPWFPSRQGDWVVMSDGTYGEVEAQTPDMVRLRLKGGANRSYKTQEYLSLSPTNLSKGFRITAVFGLDYQHQAGITEEIPHAIEQALVQGLRAQGYGGHMKRIEVEFMTAGASSLDLAVKAEFDGDTALWYQRLQRAIQRICVDACNTHGWVIPFQQVTVHIPEQSGQQDR
ncbi:MAG: mechanosensitive ion channel family protein [Deltaproteobacteria bacterium]|nr:mechanosensitive ion channel family protein [Deltaproteobacteria bacterium]